MKIVLVSSEAIPFCKTGGLADVVGTLAKEIEGEGEDVRLFIPYYEKIVPSFGIEDTGYRATVPLKGKDIILSLYRHGSTFLVAVPGFFDRNGIYGEKGHDYTDNDLRFSLFAQGVLRFLKLLSFKPDIIHLNDWQTGMLPVYLREYARKDEFYKGIGTVFTIHNIGYQGVFARESLSVMGIEERYFSIEGVEFYGNVNFLKAGIVFSDFVTTVSPRYAEEITTPAYGFGLDGVLRAKKDKLKGILNGIDYSVWSPETDRYLYRRFTPSDLRGRALCRYWLMKSSGLYLKSGYPVISYVGRFASQKGVELILEVIPYLVGKGFPLVILGTGERPLEKKLLDLSSRYDEGLFVYPGFDEKFAHMIYAGSDIIMIPSLYEPCGLVQLIALRYGAVPVARMTGGLADTIEDYNVYENSGTGFLFEDYNPSCFLEALKRAVSVFPMRKRWHSMMRRGMEMDFSWKSSVKRYIELYNEVRQGVQG
ncbi:MAG: glycogen synthase GlgA [Nitrospirae bacterium]|nr:MAG: glycogen synthase GlgA [Nitrospirota bacterium]